MCAALFVIKKSNIYEIFISYRDLLGAIFVNPNYCINDNSFNNVGYLPGGLP